MRSIVTILLFTSVSATVGCGNKNKGTIVVPPGGGAAPNSCFTIQESCTLKMKQTKFGFSFGGLDFTSQPVQKIGEVKLDTDVVQKLTNVAQILDQMQLDRCETLNRLTSCDSSRQQIIIVQQASAEQLAQLAILAEMYSGNAEKLQDAVLKWMAQSADLIQKIYAKQFMAADPQVASNKQKALEAAQLAASKLHLDPASPEFQRIAQGNVLRSDLQ